jgi:hypothetical protein
MVYSLRRSKIRQLKRKVRYRLLFSQSRIITAALAKS